MVFPYHFFESFWRTMVLGQNQFLWEPLVGQGSGIPEPFLLVLFLEKSEKTASYIDMNLLTGASMVMWKCLLLLNSLLYIWLQDNNIVFWRKFVNEYFAPRAKKRWCVSLYGSGGQQPTGVFQQVSIELDSIFSSLLLNFLCNTVVSVFFPTAIHSLPTHPIC